MPSAGHGTSPVPTDRNNEVSLLDDLKSVQARKPSLPEWLLARKPEERAAFEAAIDDLNVPINSLMQIVRNHGGATTVKSLEAMRAARVAR